MVFKVQLCKKRDHVVACSLNNIKPFSLYKLGYCIHERMRKVSAFSRPKNHSFSASIRCSIWQILQNEKNSLPGVVLNSKTSSRVITLSVESVLFLFFSSCAASKPSSSTICEYLTALNWPSNTPDIPVVPITLQFSSF